MKMFSDDGCTDYGDYDSSIGLHYEKEDTLKEYEHHIGCNYSQDEDYDKYDKSILHHDD